LTRASSASHLADWAVLAPLHNSGPPCRFIGAVRGTARPNRPRVGWAWYSTPAYYGAEAPGLLAAPGAVFIICGAESTGDGGTKRVRMMRRYGFHGPHGGTVTSAQRGPGDESGCAWPARAAPARTGDQPAAGGTRGCSVQPPSMKGPRWAGPAWDFDYQARKRVIGHWGTPARADDGIPGRRLL